VERVHKNVMLSLEYDHEVECTRDHSCSVGLAKPYPVYSRPALHYCKGQTISCSIIKLFV